MDAMNGEALLVAGQAVSLRSLVADRPRLATVTGRFRPGQQLRERELCELTGVSRPSLREALRRLEAEGLITTPHRGPAVTALSVEQAERDDGKDSCREFTQELPRSGVRASAKLAA